MLKKLKKITKFSLVGMIWSYVYIYCTGILMFLLWNFDYLSTNDWQTIGNFWEGGGSIKTGKDYIFMTMLLLIIPFWILGWRYFYKINFVQLLLSPIIWYNKRQIKKYGPTTNIVLKNMGTNKKGPQLQEMIADRVKLANKQKEPASLKIRESVQEKISTTENKK